MEVDNSFCRIPSIQLIQQPQYSDDASDLIIFSPQSQPDAPFGLYAAGNMSSFLASLPSDGLNLIANEQAANLATKIIPLDDLLFPYPNGTQDMVSHVEALESLPIAESKCVSSEIYDAPLRANTAVLPAHSWTTLFREYPDGDFIVEGDKNHSNSAVAIEKVEFFGSNRVVRR